MRTAEARVSTPPQATKTQRTNDMRAGSSLRAARSTSAASLWVRTGAVLGLIAASWPARRAARLDVLAAIAAE